jgi:hypothetical protein
MGARRVAVRAALLVAAVLAAARASSAQPAGRSTAVVDGDRLRVRQADLAIVQPSARQRGRQPVVDIRARVLNRGPAPAPATRVEAGSSWDEARALANVRALGPGESLEVALELRVPADASGEREFTVALDPDKQAPDPDRSNNLATARATLASEAARLPDLALGEPRAEASADGRVLMVTATVRNQGDRVSPRTDLAVSADGGRAEWTEPPVAVVSSLAAGASQRIALRLHLRRALAAGRHDITLTVDPRQIVRDPDRRNNQGIVQVAIAPPPPPRNADLAIVRARARQRGHQPVVEIRARVRNLGPGRAPATRVEAGSSWNQARALADVRSLGPGETQEVALALPVPEDATGRREFTVSLDPDQRTGDPDTGNNVATARATLAVGRNPPARTSPEGPDNTLRAVLAVLAAAVLVLLLRTANKLRRRREREKVTPQVEARWVDRGLYGQRAELRVAPGESLELSIAVRAGEARSELALPEQATASPGSEPWPARPIR